MRCGPRRRNGETHKTRQNATKPASQPENIRAPSGLNQQPQRASKLERHKNTQMLTKLLSGRARQKCGAYLLTENQENVIEGDGPKLERSQCASASKEWEVEGFSARKCRPGTPGACRPSVCGTELAATSCVWLTTRRRFLHVDVSVRRLSPRLRRLYQGEKHQLPWASS